MTMRRLSLSTILMIHCLIFQPCFSLSCVDESGNEVDWYVVYKLPIIADSNCVLLGFDPSCEQRLSDGLAYLYLDVNSPTFQMSTNSVNDTTSAFYRTLEPVYSSYASNATVIGRGFYNDEKPDGSTTSSYGHSKGAFAFDSESGFWLIHSVPKFPNWINEGFLYPDSGTVYGQSMLCISLATQQFDTVGKHFLYANPWTYDVSIPEDLFGNVVPTLITSTVDNDHVTEEPWVSEEQIESLGGVQLQLFSKYKKADLDMVSEVMASALQSDLFSETWQNGGGSLPSDCTDEYRTFTVEYINMSSYGVEFKTTKDHSKWAVGAPDQFSHPSDWVCIGDMNRQEGQEDRSGGYACFHQSQVNSQYSTFASQLLNCTSATLELNSLMQRL